MAAFLSMSAAEANQYNDVKKAVLHRLGISQKTYRKRWWDATSQQGETTLQFAGRLIDLGVKHLEGCKTVASCNEAFSKEHLLRMLPNHIAHWVRDRDPPTTRKAAELADQYIRDRNLDQSMPFRPRQGKSEEQRPRLPEKKENGHKTDTRKDSDDQKKSERTADGKDNTKKHRLAKYFDEEKGAMCFNCREWGHIGASCPKKVLRVQTFQAPADYLVQGKVDGVDRSKIKLDSGAQHTVVHTDVVKKTAYTGDSIQLKVADGYVMELPVTFQFGEERARCTVAVSADIEEDALLGTDLSLTNELLRRETTQRAEMAKVQAVSTRTATKLQKEREQADEEATRAAGARHH